MVGHWIPKGPRKLHVIENYTAGVLALIIGMAVYILRIGRGIMIHEIILFALSGGGAVAAAYLWDWAMNKLTQG